MKQFALAVGLVCWASVAHASIGIAQADFANDKNTDDATAFTMTAGNTFVVSVVRTAGTGTFSVSGSVDGAFTATINNSPTNLWVFTKRNVTGGSQTVTLNGTDDGGTTFYYGSWLELSGADTMASITTDSTSDGSGTSHMCAATGLTGTGLFLCVGGFGSLATVTLGTGWTSENELTAVGAVIERKIETGSSEKGTFTTSVSTNTFAALVFFPEASGGGGGGGARSRLLIGVGH